MNIKNINTGETFAVTKESTKYITFEQVKGELVCPQQQNKGGEKPLHDLSEQVKVHLSPRSQTWLHEFYEGPKGDLKVSHVLCALDYLVEEGDRQNEDLHFVYEGMKFETKPRWETDRAYIEHLHDMISDLQEKAEEHEAEIAELQDFRDNWAEMIPEGPECFAERLRVWDRDVSLGIEGETAEAILRDIQTGPIRPVSYDLLPGFG